MKVSAKGEIQKNIFSHNAIKYTAHTHTHMPVVLYRAENCINSFVFWVFLYFSKERISCLFNGKTLWRTA